MLPMTRRGIAFPRFTDEFFGKDLLADIFDNRLGITTPSVNIIEGQDIFRIEVAAPGYGKEDFRLDLQNNVLTVSSEKDQKTENDDEKIMRREFSYCSFNRSFALPNTVDAEKISANYKDGVLTILIPKKEEAKVKPMRQISIS